VMEHHDRHPQRDPSVLGPDELAAIMGLTASTIRNLRSTKPQALPAPFLTRPLRWRREAVVRWMEQQEREEAERIRRLFVPSARARHGRVQA